MFAIHAFSFAFKFVTRFSLTLQRFRVAGRKPLQKLLTYRVCTALSHKVKTILKDRNLTSRVNVMHVKDKENKKASQADLDKAYLRTFTNLEDAGGVSDGTKLSSGATLQFLSKHIETADDAASSAFDGQLAKLGGIKQLDSAVQDAQQEIRSD